jgi:hypothetical protein
MKNYILTIGMLLFLISCGKSEKPVEPEKKQVAVSTKKNKTNTINKTKEIEVLQNINILKQKIAGKWELMDYDLSEENDGDQEKPSGVIWTFKEDNVCEERSDPDNPSDVTIFEYEITEKDCEKNTTSPKFLYMKLTNKTVLGDDYCFLIDLLDPIDDTDKRDRLSLYPAGAMSPNILVRK